MRKRGIKFIVVLLIAVALACLVAYFLFFNFKTCGDRICFEKSLVSCKKATYINDAIESVWYYKILGREGQSCKVYVKLLQLRKGTADNEVLVGKDMSCLLPSGFIEYPQDDLSKCSGMFKEQIQEIIINNMQKYIIDNFGKISSEFNNMNSIITSTNSTTIITS